MIYYERYILLVDESDREKQYMVLTNWGESEIRQTMKSLSGHYLSFRAKLKRMESKYIGKDKTFKLVVCETCYYLEVV